MEYKRILASCMETNYKERIYSIAKSLAGNNMKVVFLNVYFNLSNLPNKKKYLEPIENFKIYNTMDGDNKLSEKDFLKNIDNIIKGYDFLIINDFIHGNAPEILNKLNINIIISAQELMQYDSEFQETNYNNWEIIHTDDSINAVTVPIIREFKLKQILDDNGI